MGFRSLFSNTFSCLVASFVILGCLTTSGCGQTGPLYLPEDAQATSVESATPSESHSSDTESAAN